MTSPLDSTNPHGIRVVADRAPVREEARAAFAKASRSAAKELTQLTRPSSRATAAKASK